MPVTPRVWSFVLRPALVAAVFCGATAVVSPTVLAQDKTRDKAQAVDSFALLPSALTIGQEVKVRQGAGRTTRGKVVSVSDQQLVIARHGLFRRRQEQAFTEGGVTSIELVDSKWNGAAIGAAAAVGLVAVIVEVDCSPSCDDEFGRAGRWAIASPFYGVFGLGIGALIDASREKSIYERRSRSPRIAITPWLGRDQKGVVAQVRF